MNDIEPDVVFNAVSQITVNWGKTVLRNSLGCLDFTYKVIINAMAKVVCYLNGSLLSGNVM